MTQLHLQIRSTSTEIQNAITQMQSKRLMQAHVCFYFLTTAPPKHFCFIIYKSAIVLNECKATHCSGAFFTVPRLYSIDTQTQEKKHRSGESTEENIK